MVFLAEYIWIGGNNELRSKCRVMNECDKDSIYSYSDWNYDGSWSMLRVGTTYHALERWRAGNPYYSIAIGMP